VSTDPLKCTFWDTIFRPLGGAAPSNFYTRQRLTKPCYRTPQGGSGVRENFNRENVKFGHKFSVLRSITSRLVGVSSWTFSVNVPRGRGDNVGNFYKARLQKFVTAKNRQKFFAIFDNFRL